MKKLVVCLMVVTIFSGCSWLCKFSPKHRDMVKDTIHQLQDGYEDIVDILKKTPDARVAIAVALADASLEMLGKALDKWCPTEGELNLALVTAKAAQEAKLKVLK